jgi:hypothetical protein
MVSSRRLLTILLGLSAALWASPILAQTGGSTLTSTGGTTGSVTQSDFTITLEDKDQNTLSATDAATYLNQARCQCGTKVNFLVQMLPASASKLASVTIPGSYSLYAGNACKEWDNNSTDANSCSLLEAQSGVTTLATSSWTVPAYTDKLFAAAGGCNTTTTTTPVWLQLNYTGGSIPDLYGSSAPSLALTLSGVPPPAPTGISVEGGQEALNVTWDLISTTSVPDLAGYLVFCIRGGERADADPPYLQVFNPSPYSGQYYTAQTLAKQDSTQCPSPPTGTSTSITTTLTTSIAAAKTTATEVVAPAPFQTLDSNYLCSDLIPPSQDSARISVLQNGIAYQVGVAAVDNAGNASPIQNAFIQRPVPTIDFYTEYRSQGGKATGGYCALAGQGSRLGTISFLAGGGLVALIIFRRRRRARRAMTRGLPFLLLALTAGSAQAQVSVSHEDGEDRDFGNEHGHYETPKEWAIELRFGPYRPNVDSEFSGSTGSPAPYQLIFGGKRHLMSGMELDWQFFQAFGTLAAGVGFGYFKATATAFQALADNSGQCVKDSNDNCVPSGDNTSLRLIPLSALLVYRWDVAADRWGIPLVPYAKLGLNYTLWKVTDGNGSVPYPAAGGHGSGGTAGWQGALGGSFLLDFIDPSAARSLDMETNINHSYFFFEWNWVQATGLGMSNKLHVGDSRWVLGLMFEF